MLLLIVLSHLILEEIVFSNLFIFILLKVIDILITSKDFYDAIFTRVLLLLQLLPLLVMIQT